MKTTIAIGSLIIVVSSSLAGCAFSFSEQSGTVSFEPSSSPWEMQDENDYKKDLSR
jgi:hypothetical protein